MSENLFRLSTDDLSPEPWLATGGTQLDPLTWEIGIRSGVEFHNGNMMDAQAVKDSLERVVRLSAGSADSLAIDSIAVKDDHTITVTTTDPRPTLPGLLTAPATAVIDAAAADAAGEGNFIDAGAMTGPYIPTKYIQEERLETVANDNYWAGKPPLAGINHIAIPDTNSRERGPAGWRHRLRNQPLSRGHGCHRRPTRPPQPDRRHRHLGGDVVGQLRARYAGRPTGPSSGCPCH